MSYIARKVVILIGTLALAAQPAVAASFSGDLTTRAGGLTGTGSWGAGPSRLEWTVTDLAGGSWSYAYRLIVPGKDVSHFIVEASQNFTLANISGVASTVPLESYEVGLFGGQGNSNPAIPEPLYGIKFDLGAGPKQMEVSFVSDREPMWGDFYANDGTESQGTVDVTIRNSGFFTPDSDPLAAPPMSGAFRNHLLVPDTGFVIPEPVTLLAVGVSLAGIGAVARKNLRRRK
ncbi:MAG: hypothetical protein ACYTF6_02580 [Planctomycetota bacterium]|jgi:hypothetical protein